jgi:predicted NBD/HSP70 family sugar kinase
MNQPTTLGIDFGGTSIKFGVVQDGRIISHGNVVSTRHILVINSGSSVQRDCGQEWPKRGHNDGTDATGGADDGHSKR